MNLSEDVDFDFFDTPRNEISETQSNTRGNQSSKPPKPKRVTDERFLSKHDNERHAGGDRNKVNENQGKSPYDSLSSDDSSYSDTDSETPRVKRAPAVAPAKQVVGVSNGSAARSKGRMRPDSPESSSAYSDSDSYSDDSDYNEKSRNGVPKTNISVTLPKSAEAWGEKQDTHKDRRGDEKISKHSSDPTKFRGEYRERKTSANSEDDSDSLQEHYKHKNWTGNSKNESRDRKGNAKTEKQTRKPLRSTSSSHSNNSDITDVSPLESPEVSPRENRKRYDKVQYEGKHSSEPNVDIRLDSDKIDLSILMKCMADIDREKQQRLKANSRRVMFAPPSQHDTPKSNYTFSPNRARLIEKENQRLLQQIIHHVQPGSKKLKPGTATRLVPKKATEPIVQRLTPSGLNRQREQRKIEMENLQMLKRLQTVRATKGLSRQEQLTEFERQAAYGLPTCIMPSGTGHFNKTMPYRESSHMSGTTSVGQTQRSRPSSAKSNLSTGSRRSRPSSAKSNASIRSNASVRSNLSIRSGTSTRRDKDSRPPWDDRFSFS